MTENEVIERIREIGIVPVIRARSAQQAVLAVEAVSEGGIPIAEVTMTVPGATQAIRECRQRFGSGVLVGAGTVLIAKDAEQCIAAGAEFIISPGFDVAVLKVAQEASVPFIGGAITPTEIMMMIDHGASILKLFPCGNFGGPAYLKSLKGPFPRVNMIPTGGVNATNAAEYLRSGAFALGVGSDLVDARALESSKTEVIVKAARELVEIVKQVRGEAGAANATKSRPAKESKGASR